jgi:nucleoside-diphosphate kinase
VYEREVRRAGSMAKERTFLMIKPGSVDRGLVGEIIGRFEKRGFRILGLRLDKLSREVAEAQYQEHRGKEFYESLVSYMTSGPTVLLVLEGEDAINRAREIAGSTNPKEARPGSIRGDYGIDIQRNVLHAADSTASAKREITLHFNDLLFT